MFKFFDPSQEVSYYASEDNEDNSFPIITYNPMPAFLHSMKQLGGLDPIRVEAKLTSGSSSRNSLSLFPTLNAWKTKKQIHFPVSCFRVVQ